MLVEFYLRLDGQRDAYTGKIKSVKANAVTVSKPTTMGGDSLVLKIKLEVPAAAFDSPELVIRLKDNPVATKEVVADLQKWVADLSEPT